MYAVSAWYGVLNKRHVFANKNSLFRRAFKYVYVQSVINLEQLAIARL